MRILLVVHGFPPASTGGTELYVRDLAQALARSRQDDVSVLTSESDPGRPELAVRRTVEGRVAVWHINNTFQACASYEESYTNPALVKVAGGLLDAIRPDVAHVQHLTCLSTGIPGELARKDVPVVLTLNDYWLICHRGQLFDLDGRRCSGPFDGGCARCVPGGLLVGPAAYRAGRTVRTLAVPGASAAVRLAVEAVGSWRSGRRSRDASISRLEHMRAAMAPVQRFLAPSATVQAAFTRFGVPPERLLRCEQGIDLARFASVRRIESRVLRVGFAGGLLPSKGPHVLLEAVARLPAGSAVVDVLGGQGAYHGDHRYARRMGSLLGRSFVRRAGTVPHERMAGALADVDVLVVPSVWAENAPFIIREAFAAGAPVLASDLGGMAEMVRHGVDGLLFPPGDVEALAGCLERLAGERSLLERLRAGIRRPPSIDAEAEWLRGLYAGIGHGPRGARTGARHGVQARGAGTEGEHERVCAVVLNYRTPDQTWLAVRSLEMSFRRPDRIIVVDNGSGDGSAAWLRERLPAVDVLEAGRNLGFAGGCNLGIQEGRRSGADFVLLVNSDAVLAPDALGILLEAAARSARAGILSPVILSREEPDRIASAGISFSQRTGRMRHVAAGEPVNRLSAGRCLEVDATSGCVMLIRSGVLDSAGLLDDDYFYSFEDIDLCLRARRDGYRIVCVPEAVAYHEGGASIGRRSTRRVYFATRNHLRLSRATARPGARGWLQAGLIVGLNVAYVLRSRDAPLIGGLAAVARGIRDHAVGRYGSD